MKFLKRTRTFLKARHYNSGYNVEPMLNEIELAEEKVKRMEDDVEFATAVRWAAERGMFAVTENGLVIVLERYKESLKGE